QGTTVIRVRAAGKTVEVPVTVGDLAKARPISYANEVMAVLGKAGCNAGACHGHNSGKGGFKLSLRGYNPDADHGALMARIDRKEPHDSLILQKPTGQQSHRGGKRFDVDSDFYKVLHAWLTEGAKGGLGASARLERIEVLPDAHVFPQTGLQQQL